MIDSRTTTPRTTFAVHRYAVLAIFSLLMAVAYQATRLRAAPLDFDEQVRTILVSWGFEAGEFAPAGPGREEIDRHVALLGDSDPEKRTLAAHWLADHGVREARLQLVAAMQSPGTLLPCRMAQALGRLGDPRSVGPLLEAVNDPTNADLRLCAARALGRIQSPEAVDTLIDAYRRDRTAIAAIDTLGMIADPAAIPMLEEIAERPRNDSEKLAAKKALDRIRLLQSSDPVPGLIDELHASARRGPLDEWTVRRLVELDDPHVPSLLTEIEEELPKNDRRSRALIHAARIACEGRGHFMVASSGRR
jgi:HEAT repeat protein